MPILALGDAASFVTERTFVRVAPQDLRALNLTLFSLPPTNGLYIIFF
jgi:hypothetical protein